VNCIVTAGPTYEPLDEVRRLTNFSTGKLGSELADFLSAKGHQVILLKGYYAVHQADAKADRVITFTTTADLRERLRALAHPTVQAVFHAAAVSDFGFGKVFKRLASGELAPVTGRKFSTGQEPLLAELVPTPKIIAELRGWFPGARLTGWKYEVDGNRKAAVSAGASQIRHCDTDVCVVNGPAYGEGFGVLRKGLKSQHVADRLALFEVLEEIGGE
jgi:phosphopantothenate---cysteine ligase (CTP)